MTEFEAEPSLIMTKDQSIINITGYSLRETRHESMSEEQDNTYTVIVRFKREGEVKALAAPSTRPLYCFALYAVANMALTRAIYLALAKWILTPATLRMTCYDVLTACSIKKCLKGVKSRTKHLRVRLGLTDNSGGVVTSMP
jgi:hypothetical protein